MSGRAHAICFAATLAALLVVTFERAAPGALVTYHLGLDFIESPTAAHPGFLYDFEPYPITDPSTRFVTDGGLAGWSQPQARLAITLRTEDAFRAIDTGDPNRTVRVAIHLGAVPQSIRGHRYNVAMCQSSSSFWSLWGQQVNVPEDDYTAAVYLDEIDQEPRLTYETAERALNAIVGTTAHEIGHFFGANHVAAGDTEPYPLMAIESTGLPTQARLTVRRFCEESVAAIVPSAGTVSRADFDMSDYVDGQDINVLISNHGRSDALFQEGDATGDHKVDAQDINALVSNFTAADSGPPDGATAAARYNPATGEFTVSVRDVLSWALVSDGKFTGEGLDVVGDLPRLGGAYRLVSANFDTVGEGGFGPPITYGDVHLGEIAQPGLDPSDFALQYVVAFGQPTLTGPISAVAEPGTALMLPGGVLAVLLWLLRRRRTA